MSKMRAAVVRTFKKPLEITEIEIPKPTGFEALVRWNTQVFVTPICMLRRVIGR